eukprot:PITA_26504
MLECYNINIEEDDEDPQKINIPETEGYHEVQEPLIEDPDITVPEKKKKGEIRICVELRKLNDAYVHDPFPTPFIEEVLENVSGQEAYSFTDRFLGYHQIKIASEDRRKTTFSIEWGYFKYTVMSFGLKNVPTIVLRIVVSAFKEYIHKFLEAYLDDWTVFGIVKHHVASLRLMLDT